MESEEDEEDACLAGLRGPLGVDLTLVFTVFLVLVRALFCGFKMGWGEGVGAVDTVREPDVSVSLSSIAEDVEPVVYDDDDEPELDIKIL